MNNYMFFMMFVSVIKIFSSEKIINVLLGLEMLSLTGFFTLMFVSQYLYSQSDMLLIFLFLMVSESVLGLSLFINLTMNKGNANVNMIMNYS